MKVDNILLCGAAQIDITPPQGAVMNGDFIQHYARKIRDPIFAKALVFATPKFSLAIILVDTCFVPADLTSGIKDDIFKVTGVPSSNIVVAATHIHSGGALADVFLTEADEKYMEFVRTSVVQVTNLANANMQPAKISFGKVDVPEHVVCRRYKMKPGFKAFHPLGEDGDEVVTNPFGYETEIAERLGTVDPEVSFLAVRATSGKWISILANYSLHYVGDFEENVVSSDYFGIFAQKLTEKIGGDDGFVGMMSNGTSGNVNIWDFLRPGRYPSGPLEKSKIIAEVLAERIVSKLPGLIWEEHPEINILTEKLTWNIRKPSMEELKKATEIFEHTCYDEITTADHKALQKIYARELVLLSKLPAVCPMEIAAAKIGSGYIGMLPGEFFAETGLWLKQKMAENPYFTICMANDSVGYVPPDHELEAGGYETWLCRSSKLEKGAEVAIKKKLLQLLELLKEGRPHSNV